MLVVKIEVWPGGDVTRQFEIGRITGANISNLADTSDYSFAVEQRGEPRLGVPEVYEQFLIEGHERNQSVYELLRKVLDKFSEVQKTKD